MTFFLGRQQMCTLYIWYLLTVQAGQIWKGLLDASKHSDWVQGTLLAKALPLLSLWGFLLLWSLEIWQESRNPTEFSGTGKHRAWRGKMEKETERRASKDNDLCESEISLFYSEFHDSQKHIEKPCFKRTKINKWMNERTNKISKLLIAR